MCFSLSFVYVDDLILDSKKQAVADKAFEALRRIFELRRTGTISKEGQFKFLSRLITRLAGNSTLYVPYDPSYFEPLKQWVAKSVKILPQVRAILDSEDGSETLSDETSTRYRSALGRQPLDPGGGTIIEARHQTITKRSELPTVPRSYKS